MVVPMEINKHSTNVSFPYLHLDLRAQCNSLVFPDSPLINHCGLSTETHRCSHSPTRRLIYFLKSWFATPQTHGLLLSNPNPLTTAQPPE